MVFVKTEVPRFPLTVKAFWRTEELRWGEMSLDMLRLDEMKCGVWSVEFEECSVECGVSSVTFGRAHHFRTKHARLGLIGPGRTAHARWKRSYSITVFCNFRPAEYACTTGVYIYIYMYYWYIYTHVFGLLATSEQKAPTLESFQCWKEIPGSRPGKAPWTTPSACCINSIPKTWYVLDVKIYIYII